MNMFKKWVCSLPLVKRMGTSILLWILFGIVCVYFASTSTTITNFWWSAMMWNLIFNRFLIWMIIAFAWFIQVHPILKIRMFPPLRWFILWFLVSLDIAFWPFISATENAWSLFWWIVIIWAIYGLIIDSIASKVWWEWEMLLEGTRKK